MNDQEALDYFKRMHSQWSETNLKLIKYNAPSQTIATACEMLSAIERAMYALYDVIAKE